MLDQSKVCVSQIKSLCLVCACVIKCLIKVNGVVLLSALYFFWICVCQHMLCRKLYRKTSVGETHRDSKMRFNHETHKIQKAMDQEPRSPKMDQDRPESGLPGLLYGPPGPPQCHLTSCFVHDRVCDPYTLFSYVLLSVSNRIENH